MVSSGSADRHVTPENLYFPPTCPNLFPPPPLPVWVDESLGNGRPAQVRVLASPRAGTGPLLFLRGIEQLTHLNQWNGQLGIICTLNTSFVNKPKKIKKINKTVTFLGETPGETTEWPGMLVILKQNV